MLLVMLVIDAVCMMLIDGPEFPLLFSFTSQEAKFTFQQALSG